MKKTRQHSAKPLRSKRLDGVGQWDQTLDLLVWLFLRAGVTPTQISRHTATTLKRQRGTPALKIPSPEVLEYTRVLTFWRTEPSFMNGGGQALPLPLKGRTGSFQALVRLALPEAKPADVLTVLKRHGIIRVSRSGIVTLLSAEFVPQNDQLGQFVAYTLTGIQGILTTCVTNLTATDPAQSIGLVQRMAFSERFDERYLAKFDDYTRHEVGELLRKIDAWLKRHEVSPSAGKRRRGAQVGLGVFGFRPKKT